MAKRKTDDLEEELEEELEEYESEDTDNDNEYGEYLDDYSDNGDSSSDNDEEYDDEEYDEEDDEDDESSNKKSKIILVSAFVVAALAIAGGVMFYQKQASKNQTEQVVEKQETNDQEKETETGDGSAETEESEAIEDTELETEENETEPDIDDVIDEMEEENLEDEFIPTSTPKPLPTATPFPDDPDELGPAEIGEESGFNNDVTEDIITTDDISRISKVVFIGDSRFRSMANVASANEYGWECSTTGDINWLTGTAYAHADSTIGKDTKVFINIGLNDLSQAASYATSINAKAAEWKEKGATVYFVSVGPVDAESDISNQDICNFNTYLFKNLNIPFIDAYNYLVQSGYTTDDNVNYSVDTSTKLYNYINNFI